MLHAVLVRSHHAHATIGGIDVSAARAMPGVVAVFTARGPDGRVADPRRHRLSAARRQSGAEDRSAAARRRIACVSSASRWRWFWLKPSTPGKDAAEAVVVDYHELPLVTDAIAALEPDAPKVWDDVPDNIGFLWKRGDAEATDAALRSAAHVARLQFTVSRVTANTMEPRGAWAEVGADGRMVVHAAHQSPYNLRNGMANGNFNIKPTDIRVLTADVGGSFGMKSGVQPEYALVAWAARRLGRPVRWISDRTEGFLTDEQAREMRITVELGLDAEHKFTALRLRWDVNLGAYVTGRSGWPVGNIGGTAGVYHIPTMYAEACGIMTNTVPTAAYRGAGRPEATYTIERIIDIAARELGISPYELRRINLIPPEAMPYKTALTFTYDCGEFEGNMQKAAEMAELDSFDARRAEAEARGRLRGIGLCNCIEVAGGPFLRPAKDQATLRLAEDGTLVLRSGSMSVGQGLETAFCQLVADRFGVPLDHVRYEAGDTDLLSGGKGNGGSGALCIGGSAVSLAVDKVIEKAKQVAAELLEAAEVDVTFDAGRFTIAGTDRSVGLAEVAHAAIDRRERTGGKRRIHPDRGDLPERHAYLRGGDRSRHRRDRGRALQRGGGTRLRAQSDAGGGADAWRCRAGRRPGDGRADRARSALRPDADGVVHGLPDAARGRPAGYPHGDARGADQGQSAGCQGRRRGGHRRRDGGGDECGERCAGAARHPPLRHAGDAASRLGRRSPRRGR